MMTYPQWLLDIPDNLAPRRDGMCRVEAAKYGLGCDDLEIEVFCPEGESLVKSQSPQKKRELGEIAYPVTLQPQPHCTCRDFEHWAQLEAGRACKHILAIVLRLYRLA